MEYTVRRTDQVPLFSWEAFEEAETAVLTHIDGPATAFPPQVRVRLLHSDRTIYGIFQVRERGVVARKTAFQDMVCVDSCCEFFFQPAGQTGYFNLEMNAGSSFLVYFVRNPAPDPNGKLFQDYTPLARREGNFLTVKTDLPHYIPEPVMEERLWHLAFTVPLAALEPYCGKIAPLSGQTWRGNFYKCGDAAPWPGWLTWAKLVGTTSFHAPQCFEKLIFA